jgi:uncharacterized membrane protein YtjA (UPF0391 family)
MLVYMLVFHIISICLCILGIEGKFQVSSVSGQCIFVCLLVHVWGEYVCMLDLFLFLNETCNVVVYTFLLILPLLLYKMY